MTATVTIQAAGRPLNVTKIMKMATSDERSSTEKIPPGKNVKFFADETMAIRVDELPYEAPATDR